jgi:hypothetical protein
MSEIYPANVSVPDTESNLGDAFHEGRPGEWVTGTRRKDRLHRRDLPRANNDLDEPPSGWGPADHTYSGSSRTPQGEGYDCYGNHRSIPLDAERTTYYQNEDIGYQPHEHRAARRGHRRTRRAKDIPYTTAHAGSAHYHPSGGVTQNRPRGTSRGTRIFIDDIGDRRNERDGWYSHGHGLGTGYHETRRNTIEVDHGDHDLYDDDDWYPSAEGDFVTDEWYDECAPGWDEEPIGQGTFYEEDRMHLRETHLPAPVMPRDNPLVVRTRTSQRTLRPPSARPMLAWLSPSSVVHYVGGMLTQPTYEAMYRSHEDIKSHLIDLQEQYSRGTISESEYVRDRTTSALDYLKELLRPLTMDEPSESARRKANKLVKLLLTTDQQLSYSAQTSVACRTIRGLADHLLVLMIR